MNVKIKKNHVSIGLINPKDTQNVGSVLRAIGCYQADDVYFTGSRYEHALKHNTDTHNVAQNSLISKVESMTEARDLHMPKGTKIVCVELVEGATSLPSFKHPENALYVFGPEDGNLKQAVVNSADEVVYIPTVGCMNLAATVNVLLYDRLAKQAEIEESDELIRQSRDNNNRLKV
jgi:tRNA(Leu) C34 or U34 (ribose-2'-O)-methylase TrmL